MILHSKILCLSIVKTKIWMGGCTQPQHSGYLQEGKRTEWALSVCFISWAGGGGAKPSMS